MRTRDFFDVAGSSLSIGISKASFYRVRRKLLYTQLIDSQYNLLINCMTSLAIPVLQDFFDCEVCVLILRELNNRPADLFKQSSAHLLCFSFSHNLLYYAQSVLINR